MEATASKWLMRQTGRILEEVINTNTHDKWTAGTSKGVTECLVL